jgi:predicted  nucleic acid-binding Zn-ribbon protein
MLVDLETAKVELDLANERASEAQQQAGSLRVQLAASEQRCQTLEAQLQSTQKK